MGEVVEAFREVLELDARRCWWWFRSSPATGDTLILVVVAVAANPASAAEWG